MKRYYKARVSLALSAALFLATNLCVYASNDYLSGATPEMDMIPNASNTVTVDYVGNYVYEEGTLTKILFDGGYVDMTGSEPKYMYYLTDHLGNVRVVADSDGNVTQVNHYYPYGDRFEDSRYALASSSLGSSDRLFGGKELDSSSGLHDFEARYDNTILGRFTTMDPMAEKYYGVSPYSYCAGNPVNRVDTNGESWYFSLEDGTFLTHIQDNDDWIYMLTKEQISEAARNESTYHSFRNSSNTFGQMMLNYELTDKAIKGVYLELYSRANKKNDDESSTTYLPDIPNIIITSIQDVKYKGRTINPQVTTSNITGDLTIYKYNLGHEWNGYDMINLLSHELKHRIDVIKGQEISEINADFFSKNHWSYRMISQGRKDRIEQHLNENSYK